jgi:hypothetical protein
LKYRLRRPKTFYVSEIIDIAYLIDVHYDKVHILIKSLFKPEYTKYNIMAGDTTVKGKDELKKVNVRNAKREKLNYLKYLFENGQIKTIEQMFPIMAETSLCNALGISFYAFRNKVKEPTGFSIGEMMVFATLLGTSYDRVHAFIVELVKAKTKSKVFNT